MMNHFQVMNAKPLITIDGKPIQPKVNKELEKDMKEHFIVVAGKFERHKDEVERNYKYISEPHETFELALKDFIQNVGYPFCEIEYVSEDGRTWRMNPSSLESKVREQIAVEKQVSRNDPDQSPGGDKLTLGQFLEARLNSRRKGEPT